MLLKALLIVVLSFSFAHAQNSIEDDDYYALDYDQELLDQLIQELADGKNVFDTLVDKYGSAPMSKVITQQNLNRIKVEIIILQYSNEYFIFILIQFKRKFSLIIHYYGKG